MWANVWKTLGGVVPSITDTRIYSLVHTQYFVNDIVGTFIAILGPQAFGYNEPHLKREFTKTNLSNSVFCQILPKKLFEYCVSC